MRIVFFGTPNFAKNILEYLLKQKVEVLAVVTRPDKPRGRHGTPQSSPVKEFALVSNLPLYQPEKASSPDFSAFLKTLDADFFIVAAYAEILKENILEIPRLGCINVHASILPKYRGAAPIHRCVMAGEKESGVTIMKMAKELDAGDILAIEKTPISEEMTTGELEETLSKIGKEALWKVMQAVESGTIVSIPQDASQVSYAKKVTLEDALVDWSRPCDVVHNQIRGMTPKPGAWCWIEVRGQKKRLRIHRAKKELSLSGNPGQILSRSPLELIVGCGEGAISLLKIQLEGKKSMSTDLFLRGFSPENLKF